MAKKIECEKLFEVSRKIKKNRIGKRICGPLNGSEKLYLNYIQDIENEGKRICDKCKKLQFCYTHACVFNNHCGVDSCQTNLNTVLNLSHINYINFFSVLNVTHTHVMCKSCFNNRVKDIPITVHNDTFWKKN